MPKFQIANSKFSAKMGLLTMHSFLIVGINKEKLISEARDIAGKMEISPIDISFYEDEKAFGIEAFRQIKDKIFLRPVKGNKKAVVLDFFGGATPETQNAMLKILEEPPSSAIIIILGKKKDEFLPTIISRCQVVELSEPLVIEETEFPEIVKGGIGKKLVAAQNLSRDKDKAIEFIKNTILYLRREMKKEVDRGINANDKVKSIKELEKARYALSETNINPRMTLENLFLSL